MNLFPGIAKKKELFKFGSRFIEELNISLMDVGWDNSGGRSRNVWGNVEIPQELVDYARDYIRATGMRPSIWTCFDDRLYTKDADGKWQATPENLPSRVSATFKCSRTRLSPIVENMSMRIALALDLPTTYNYIVKYTPELHEQITDHINPAGVSETNINEYGIVSVDMLKPGDELIHFNDSERMAGQLFDSNAYDSGYVENWMKSISRMASGYLSGASEEETAKSLSRIYSRIARSTLLRSFLGDCDFTAMNSGYIANPERHTLEYAPNFDYGESFTSLRVSKLEGIHFNEEQLKFILARKPDYLETKEQERSKTIRQIAQEYESGTSKENLRFIATHFEDDIVEFLMSLNQAVEDNVISDIIYSYAKPNKYGDKLLSLDEAKMFDEYLTARANWISFEIIKDILEAEPEKFLDKVVKGKTGPHTKSFPLEKLEGFVAKKFDTLPEEEKAKLKAFDESVGTEKYLKKADFLRENFPAEFGACVKNIEVVLDNFWRKPLAENFIEYFHLQNSMATISKDDVKRLFLQQFIDKTFTSAYKAAKAPLPAPKTENKGKV